MKTTTTNKQNDDDNNSNNNKKTHIGGLGNSRSQLTFDAVSLKTKRKNVISNAQFSSAQDGIYALRKAHMRSTTSLRSSPNVAFETGPMFV